MLDRIAAAARARAYPRSAHALSGLRRGAAGRGEASASASSRPFGGPTSSGMLTLHCPPARCMRWPSFLREHGAQAVVDCRHRLRVRRRERALHAARPTRLDGGRRGWALRGDVGALDDCRLCSALLPVVRRNTTKCDSEKLTRKLDADRADLGDRDRDEIRRDPQRRRVGDERRRCRRPRMCRRRAASSLPPDSAAKVMMEFST